MTMAMDPWSLSRDFDRLFELALGGRREISWAPRTDVLERDGEFVIRVEVPGMDTESLDVTVEAGTLSIAGERSFERVSEGEGYHRKEIYEGSFRRSVALPDGLDLDSISASTRDGILEITLKKSPEVLPRKVKVELGP